MHKSKYEILDEALRFESDATRRMMKGLREGESLERAHADYDEALRRWLVLGYDLEADLRSSVAFKFTADFTTGIDNRLFGPRALATFRIAASWTLGTRSIPVEVTRDRFPIDTPGDLLIEALLAMSNPWSAEAALKSIDRQVGESLNELLLSNEKPAGADEICELVLMARDYLCHPEYLDFVLPRLEEARAKAHEVLFRPTAQILVNMFYLVARELVMFGPAIQMEAFRRDGLAIPLQLPPN